MMEVKAITPEQLEQVYKQNGEVDLLDCRKPKEFSKLRVSFARNVPMHEIDVAEEIRRRADKADPLFVICKVGGRSHVVCEAFIAAGYDNVINIAGGTDGCVGTELPLEQGPPTASP